MKKIRKAKGKISPKEMVAIQKFVSGECSVREAAKLAGVAHSSFWYHVQEYVYEYQEESLLRIRYQALRNMERILNGEIPKLAGPTIKVLEGLGIFKQRHEHTGEDGKPIAFQAIVVERAKKE